MAVSLSPARRDVGRQARFHLGHSGRRVRAGTVRLAYAAARARYGRHVPMGLRTPRGLRRLHCRDDLRVSWPVSNATSTTRNSAASPSDNRSRRSTVPCSRWATRRPTGSPHRRPDYRPGCHSRPLPPGPCPDPPPSRHLPASSPALVSDRTSPAPAHLPTSSPALATPRSALSVPCRASCSRLISCPHVMPRLPAHLPAHLPPSLLASALPAAPPPPSPRPNASLRLFPNFQPRLSGAHHLETTPNFPRRRPATHR